MWMPWWEEEAAEQAITDRERELDALEAKLAEARGIKHAAELAVAAGWHGPDADARIAAWIAIEDSVARLEDQISDLRRWIEDAGGALALRRNQSDRRAWYGR